MLSARVSSAYPTARGDHETDVPKPVSGQSGPAVAADVMGPAAPGNGDAEAGRGYLWIEDFRDVGARALVTTRANGDFSLHGEDPVSVVTERWRRLRRTMGVDGPGGRFATAGQVHGNRVAAHGPGWDGWLRVEGVDGHFAAERGTALAISVADCVPVFLVHAGGAAALVHAGWRGTASGVLLQALQLFIRAGLRPGDVRVHLGPAICGRCYEVGPKVFAQLTGRRAEGPARIDLRAVLAEQARQAGIRTVLESPRCTRCHNDQFFSHRAGDAGRQVAVLYPA